MDDIHKTFKEYNPNKKRKILIVFNYIIADILGNKKLDAIVTEPFIKYFSCFYHTILFSCTKKY